jgi:hypothetical protein
MILPKTTMRRILCAPERFVLRVLRLGDGAKRDVVFHAHQKAAARSVAPRLPRMLCDA